MSSRLAIADEPFPFPWEDDFAPPEEPPLAELAARAIHHAFRSRNPGQDSKAWEKLPPATREEFLIEGRAVVDAFVTAGVLAT